MKRINKRAEAFRLAARVPLLAAEHEAAALLLKAWGKWLHEGLSLQGVEGAIAALRAAHEAANG